MDLGKLKQDFESAVSAKPHASSFAFVAFGTVAGLLFVVGILGLFVAFDAMGAGSAMGVGLGLYGGLGALILMGQGAIVSLLVSIAKDNRDTNRIIRLVAVSMMKRKAA